MPARLHRFVRASLIVAVVMVAVGPPFAASAEVRAFLDPSFGEISGQILSEAGGNSPIAEAQVTARNDAGEVYYSTTDSGGRFDIPFAKPGGYRIEVDSIYIYPSLSNNLSPYFLGANSLDSEAAIVVSAGATLAVPAIVVPPGATISGTVAVPAGAKVPIDVTAYKGGGTPANTPFAQVEASGQYTINGLWPGSYTIQFAEGGFAYPPTVLSKVWKNKTNFESATPVVVTSQQAVTGIDANLQLAASISGRVTDSTGSPVADADISLYSLDGVSQVNGTSTRSDGSYSIGGVAAGTYLLRVEHQFWDGPNLGANWASTWLGGASFADASTRVTVAAGQALAGQDIQAGIGASVAGTVTLPPGDPSAEEVQVAVLALGKNPATGAWVQQGSGITNPDGTYVVQDLPAGTYELLFDSEGFNVSTSNQYWPNAAQQSGARSFKVKAGSTMTGHDAALLPLPLAPGSPRGRVDSVVGAGGTITTSGWSVDPDTNQDVTITVSIDGTAQTPVYADLTRTNLPSKFAAYGQQHGFEETYAGFVPGRSYLVCVTAQNLGAAAPDSNLGCRQVRLPTGSPFGVFGSATGGPDGVATVTGWAIDPDTVGRVKVRATVDGTASTTFLASAAASDIPVKYVAYGENHGFVASLDDLSIGTHTICLTAVNRESESRGASLGCKNVTIVSGRPFGVFDPAVVLKSGGVPVSGWAIDPDTSAPISVRLTVDGAKLTDVLSGVMRPHLGANYPKYGSAHGFSATLTGVKPGMRVICAVALDTAKNSDNTQLGCQAVMIPKS